MRYTGIRLQQPFQCYNTCSNDVSRKHYDVNGVRDQLFTRQKTDWSLWGDY